MLLNGREDTLFLKERKEKEAQFKKVAICIKGSCLSWHKQIALGETHHFLF